MEIREMKKPNIFDIMIVNATDWKWVDKEIVELSDAGYDTLRKVLTYYSEIFKENKVSAGKFKIFANNFLHTYRNEIA